MLRGLEHPLKTLTALVALAAGVLVPLSAQVRAQSAPRSPLPGKGAGPRQGTIMRVEISCDRAKAERLIEEGYDVDSIQSGGVVLYVDADELKQLRRQGWTLSVKLPYPEGPSPSWGSPRILGQYNDYTNMTAMLDGYAASFPGIYRKLSLGKSVQGRDLWAVKITSNPDVAADKPKFKYISTMHGNEPLGTEMCLYLIDRLLNGYTTNDARITRLVNNVEIWLLPLMNPDGRQANPPQRYNANGYDLNRSFPEGSDKNMGNWLYGPAMNTNGLQPEVGEVMTWTAAHTFSLGANFHSGSLVVNFPYDNDNMGSVLSPAPDDALIQAMSRTYSSNNAPMWNSAAFAQGIVNGAAWYAITGGMQDWNYRYVGCFDATIELANYQWPDPPASSLPTYWSQNQESMLAYMEWVLRGVRGVLRDAQTGQPIHGAIRVEGYPHLVFSDPTVGDYHRLLRAGAYTLWFCAPGYVPRRVPNVAVGGGDATRLDISMQPVSARFAAKIHFQPTNTPVPVGFLADSGAAFGARNGGYSYGWESDFPTGEVFARNSGASQDLRYDSFCSLQWFDTWKIALPNGPYSVLIAAGDPGYTNGFGSSIAAENVVVLEGLTTATNRWIEALATVVVTNQVLMINNSAAATNNRLDFIEISAVAPTNITQWRALYFGTTDNSGAAADAADPDGDGLPNLLEYALGLDPTHADTTLQFRPVLIHTNGADWFGCDFQRNPNASDVTYCVQSAGSLSSLSWSSLACYASGAGWSGAGMASETAMGLVTVLYPQPLPVGANRFLRLRVEGP